MYKETTYQIKFQDGLSGPISAIAGVKQGCVLSPLLFKIFLSDLPGIFYSACDPVQLYDTKISCLLYADDLILLSESPNGLQMCLNKLDLYCNKWYLQVKAMPHGSEKSPEKNRNEIRHSLCMPHGRGKIVANYEENDP